MLIATRHGRWLSLVAASLLMIPPGAGARQAGGTSQAAAWTGTITVKRHASGSFRAAPNPLAIGFTGDQTVTYTLNGDGTASWHSTFSNNVDMGGQYSIPSQGSGSGIGRGGAEFNGQGWEISVEAEDSLPTVVDYSAQDQWWLTHTFLAELKELAAMSGKPVPPLGAHFENGATGVPGVGVVSRGAQNATTLSGSDGETVSTSSDIGGLPTIPMTVTVTWNLTRAPVRPHVTIYGPECGCLDPDATEKTLHFIAGASPAGGEFSEFIVTANGPAPEIASNQGGEQPSLDITGTKDTGTVTLKIRYRRNGTTTESAPFIVDFCAIEPIELADGNEHDLAFDLDGKLIVDAKAKAWCGGRDVSKELEWDVEKMGAPTSLSAEPSTRKGDHIKFTYENLPKSNSDFGKKKLTAKTTGQCACQREETIRTFFPDVDNNHPDDGTPNWFYYWKQSAAVTEQARAMLRFNQVVSDANAPEASVLARYDHETETILISDKVLGVSACRGEVERQTHTPTGRQAKGIDCFAETVRHELQHRTDAIEWWGTPKGPYGTTTGGLFTDSDGDHLPLGDETRLPGCSPISQKSCDDRPFGDATDAEVNAYWVGWTWPIGSANGEDWSCGDLSKQWKGKKCGR